MSMPAHPILYDENASLQELQEHTTINNDKLREKKTLMDEKIKRIKELKMEHSRRQSQAALQSQGQYYGAGNSYTHSFCVKIACIVYGEKCQTKNGSNQVQYLP